MWKDGSLHLIWHGCTWLPNVNIIDWLPVEVASNWYFSYALSISTFCRWNEDVELNLNSLWGKKLSTKTDQGGHKFLIQYATIRHKQHIFGGEREEGSGKGLVSKPVICVKGWS